ncbi:MAG: hypothetical protein IPM02_16420 [Betaproteobacteria bacterium]|nr:hypothetical protein [Betaproteobacteria bacterium]
MGRQSPDRRGLKAGLRARGPCRRARGELRAALHRRQGRRVALGGAGADQGERGLDPDEQRSGRARRQGRHPENLTGIAGGATQIVAKRIEILRTLVPKLRRVWFIYRAGDPIDAAAVTAADQAAKTLKVELVVRPVESAEQLKRTLLEVRPGDGLLAPEMDALDITAAILDKSLGTRVPAVFATAHWVARGGLISSGPDLYAQGVQAAAIVARILQGMRPQDVPVQAADDIAPGDQSETARLFALDVPRKILFRADVLQR